LRNVTQSPVAGNHVSENYARRAEEHNVQNICQQGGTRREHARNMRDERHAGKQRAQEGGDIEAAKDTLFGHDLPP
jgi:hypothetical protein